MLAKRLHLGGQLVGLKVIRAKPRQNFSTKFVTKGATEGWLNQDGDFITIHGVDGPLTYRILRRPGIYSCFDGREFSSGTEARAYIIKNHGGQVSPDKENPAGYKILREYKCALESVHKSAESANKSGFSLTNWLLKTMGVKNG
jgi:hypothetical protein